jgi:mannose-1-phosphate guanylyltransferase
MTILTNEDKAGIINQHLRNLHYNKFNIEISIVEENAKATPETAAVANLTAQVADFDARITALEAELDKLV